MGKEMALPVVDYLKLPEGEDPYLEGHKCSKCNSMFLGNSSDPYKVLGVTKDMPFDAIKKVYQKKRREFHPDTLISKGLPDELLDKAKEKFIEIQQAFEILEKKNSN